METNFEWLRHPDLQYVMGQLQSKGYKVYAVGGCVRDAMMNRPNKDVDLATDATPREVYAVFEDTPVKLYDTGLKHGTWTARTESGQSYEITTFRKDVVTDGRHAKVEYTKDVSDDAKRRDFTMNALYCSKDGTVSDPTGLGIADIMQKSIRFVGDPDSRCREDYLRILRLFRFMSQFGFPEDSIHKGAYIAAMDNREGLSKISGERIWEELKKILSGPSHYEALFLMECGGILKTILPNRNYNGYVDLSYKELIRGITKESVWVRRYFSLMRKEIPFPHAKEEAKKLALLSSAVMDKIPTDAKVWVYGDEVACDAATINNDVYLPNYDKIKSATKPVNAEILMNLGYVPGEVLGKALARADKLWLDSNLTMKSVDILEKIKKMFPISENV